jgi:hypothetical protein
MKIVADLIQSVKELPTKYPAVLSAYIIYSYLFFVMIRFFVLAKHSSLGFYDIVEIFDALPFMWMLAMMLVKVIDIRTKLHESETQRILKDKELEIKEIQIGTMHEVVSGMQHQVNNPLAIILATIYKVKKSQSLAPEMNGYIESIEDQSKRIARVLKDFSESQKYEVQQIGTITGSMAVPEKR